MVDIDKDLEAETAKIKASAVAEDTRATDYLRTAWQRYGIYVALAAGIGLGVVLMLAVKM